MMPSPCPASSSNAISCATIFGSPGGEALTLSTVRRCDRRLQLHRRRRRRHYFQQIVQPVPALPGGDEALPVGDGQIDRRQRTRAMIEPAMMMPAVAS